MYDIEFYLAILSERYKMIDNNDDNSIKSFSGKFFF